MLIIILIVGVFYLQRLQLTKTNKSRSVLVVYYYIQCSERKKHTILGGNPCRLHVPTSPTPQTCLAASHSFPLSTPLLTTPPPSPWFHLKHLSIIKNTA